MKKVFKVSEILDVLYKDGWRRESQRGSHLQLTHPDKKGKVTVPGQPSKVLNPKTVKSILKQAGLRL
jgi:predicted RNA binding protein YcfA (HicA-like mRNA interferase family)